MKVVLVEDEESLVDLAVMYAKDEPDVDLRFRSAGFHELFHLDYWEGVEAAIIDFHLSEPVTGLDIAVWLHEHRPDITKVILTAGFLTDKLAAEAPCRVFQKPVNPSHLFDHLRRERANGE